MLLVQGQAALPSIADLLEGAPITTRGYSHDYVPAWQVRDELVNGSDFALIKLFNGRSTVVHRRLWAALNVLAPAARTEVLRQGGGPAVMLRAIEKQPGLKGEQIKQKLKLESAPFQRDKTRLEQWLCVEGRELAGPEPHTHDSAWFPWGMCKVAAEGTAELAIEAARDILARAAFPRGAMPERKALLRAMPVFAMARVFRPG